jgi:hypothetical protein
MSIKGKKLQELYSWVNGWGDFYIHKMTLDSTHTIGKEKKPNHITEYGNGYKQAISDIFDRLNPKFRWNRRRR